VIFKRKKGLQEFDANERATIERATGMPMDTPFHRSHLAAIIERVEAAEEAKPDNWLYPYILGDYYSREKRYIESVRAADRTLELAPDDPRAVYAAANIYRTLTYAYMTAPEVAPLMPRVRQQMQMAGMDDSMIDPDASLAALEELGMSVRDAFYRALDLFKKTNTYPLRQEEKQLVEQTIQILRGEIANLPRGM
jgi:tetratricopeptide (TPR) repeat protein